ncbi:M50 family metallopeptidase [Luedemannella flava]|uniref:M50 family metallopeptidase n=1 Tax=Luedemannella flava TaxID=349316 RepID=A0ABP4YYS5_9ACTN
MFDLLDRVLRVQPAPPMSTVVATLAIALVLVMWRRSWRWVRNAVTIAHEGGHALMAVLCGRRLEGIRLHSDTSGLTFTRGRDRGPGMVLSLAAGYTAPSLLGAAGAALLATGRLTLLLWLGILLAVLMLVMIRNFYGVLSVLVTGGVLFAVSWYADSTWQAAFAYTGVWFLVIGGIRPVFELQAQRRRGQARSSDADQLARLTPLSGGAWVTVFLLVGLGAIALTASLFGVIAATRDSSLFN